MFPLALKILSGLGQKRFDGLRSICAKGWLVATQRAAIKQLIESHDQTPVGPNLELSICVPSDGNDDSANRRAR